MINTYEYDNEKWIDIDHGTPEEIGKLMDTYKIHPFIAKDLTSVTRKPRVEYRDGYIYCVLHFPAWKHTHGEDKNQEVDFVIGKNLLITARYDTIDSLHKFSKTLEVREVLEKVKIDRRTHAIFVEMLHELYIGIFEEFAAIEDITEDITSQIFHGKEKEMVVAISEVTRTLLDFKRVTDMHHEILESLHAHGKKIFGEEFGEEMESIILDYLKINTTIRSNLDMLRELRDTNNSLVSTRQNETIKQLTVMGFIILPLNLIAVIFPIPYVGGATGFWFLILIMLASTVATLLYAEHKKWL